MKTSILSLKKITLEVPHKESSILNELSFEIYPGDFIVLLGSNGSGKSSLLKVINGLMQPTSGELLFNNADLLCFPIHHRAKKIVTLTQDLNLSTFSQLTVLENCQMALHRNKRISLSISKKADESRIMAYLQAYNPHLCDKLHTPISTLSGGERQTLALAMCLWNSPELLLLDEHTSALDPHMAQKLMQLTNHVVSQKRITTIATTHNLDDALKYGNRLIAMNQGRVILDINETDKALLTKENLLGIYGRQ